MDESSRWKKFKLTREGENVITLHYMPPVPVSTQNSITVTHPNKACTVTVGCQPVSLHDQ